MSSRLDVLDGMRGFAILLVVLYHETALTGFRIEWPPYPAHPFISAQWLASTGFVGVELFFFISGFCLFYPYARHLIEGARRPGWREFAYRRFIKIVPSYLLALVVLTFVFHNGLNSLSDRLREFGVHALFLHPFNFNSFYAISGPLWTLGIEVQFYVVFPLLALAFMRMPLVTWLAVACLAFAYRSSMVTSGQYPYTFYDNQLPGVLDLFVTGMLGAYLYVRWRGSLEGNARAARIATAVAIVATVAGGFLLVSLAAADRTDVWGYYRWEMEHRFALALTCLGFALAAAFSSGGFRETVANPILVWFSLISYNLYLWHGAIISECHDRGFPCALDPLPWDRNPYWMGQFLFGSLVLAIGIATLVTYAFERPLLRLRPAWLARGRPPAEASPRAPHPSASV